jgi:squalene synthase HpnC
MSPRQPAANGAAIAVAALNGVEAPSGKDAAYENFPVGSWLLPAPLRPHVAVFYAFARAIDDIADSPDLPAEIKIARLDGFARALRGEDGADTAYAKAHAMRRTLQETGITDSHCLDLIAAFKQDAFKRRYADWADLLDYCFKSAAPVGRFLLDLHGGCRFGYGAADALCNALQVINHMQDCRDDYLDLDRVYLPMDWLADEGADVKDLAQSRSTPALRRAFDRILTHIEQLLDTAEPLPRGLASRRLAMESAAIIDIAWALVRRLRRRDPLAARIQLTKLEYAWSVGRGALSFWI